MALNPYVFGSQSYTVVSRGAENAISLCTIPDELPSAPHKLVHLTQSKEPWNKSKRRCQAKVEQTHCEDRFQKRRVKRVAVAFMLHANSGERRLADFEIRGKPGKQGVQESKNSPGRDFGILNRRKKSGEPGTLRRRSAGTQESNEETAVTGKHAAEKCLIQFR